MTVKENLRLNFRSLLINGKPVASGKEYYILGEDPISGIHAFDEEITRVKVVDPDTVAVTTEWGEEKWKRIKASLPTPVRYLRKEEIRGFRIPSIIPGTKRELDWEPTQ